MRAFWLRRRTASVHCSIAIRFLGIVASNIDEFYGVRVAGIQDQLVAGVRTPGPDGRTPEMQLALIREATNLMNESAQRELGRTHQ